MGGREVGGKFEKEIYSMMLKLSEAVHSSLGENLDICVSTTFNVNVAMVII